MLTVVRSALLEAVLEKTGTGHQARGCDHCEGAEQGPAGGGHQSRP
jgi:hypothetical protein